MNISTSLHRSHFGSRPNLEMQPDDRIHVSCSSRFSPTEAAFACMSLARARRRLIHELSLNVSQRRVGDSLTLHGSASDKARHRDILSNRYHCNYQPYNCEWWVIRSHEYIMELYSSEIVRQQTYGSLAHTLANDTCFGFQPAWVLYALPFHSLLSASHPQTLQVDSREAVGGSWFTRLEIYLHTLSWFLMSTSPLQHQWWVR